MHTHILLLLVAAAGCALLRPLGLSAAPSMSQLPHRMGRQPRSFRSDYIMSRMLMPNPLDTLGYDEDSPRLDVPTEQDWLSKEINRINQMEDDEDKNPFEDEFSRWMSRKANMRRPFGPTKAGEPSYGPGTIIPVSEYVRARPSLKEITLPESVSAPDMAIRQRKIYTPTTSAATNNDEEKKTFALTPLDKEYYKPEDNIVTRKTNVPHDSSDWKTHHKAVNVMAFQRPRQTRQNHNLAGTKNLIADNLYRVQTGLTQKNPMGTDTPRHINVLESTTDPADSIYGIALIAAVGTALAMAIFGFAFGWYTLSKKAKAAADVDYPAYEITGPNTDTSGDKKMAHSAQMYHYQHQKQQIISMERNGCEHRKGSMSDAESEDENEEGDYTVYECPGFATKGEMEVKNPLFSEDSVPSTPDKCEIVKPQSKN